MARPMKDRRMHFQTVKCLVIAVALGMGAAPAGAAIRGLCPDCHTMHNSQDGNPMNYDGSGTPNSALLRGDCLGCHAQGKNKAIAGIAVPQVYHTDTIDLAGGNFAYLTGDKGAGASDTKGHNIVALTGRDGTLYAPPGGVHIDSHYDGGNVNTDNLACAGNSGCHGYRYGESTTLGQGMTPLKSIEGAHHKNAGGQLDTADSPSNSYRFLVGVKGYESSDWEYNATASNHNEYLALDEPVALYTGSFNCSNDCHSGPDYSVAPPDNTMSQFCGTCHGDFHTLDYTSGLYETYYGIGDNTAHPFLRHPSDLVLPDDSADYQEYSNYNNGLGTYNPDVPVARTGSVPASSSSTVNITGQSGGDAVMCLSCHRAHGSPYPDMLRWDYSQGGAMEAGGGQNNTGCFVCHSAKDELR